MEITGAHREPGGAQSLSLRAVRPPTLDCEIEGKSPERRLAQRRTDARSNGLDTSDPGDALPDLLEDSAHSGTDFKCIGFDTDVFHKFAGGQPHLERNKVSCV